MGATVTTGRRVSAFRAQDGRKIYVLYEETYEKNCYPHTPHWCVIGMGMIDEVLQRIFACGSSCEGGMLQNRSGWISPEGYIRSWMKELESPFEQHDVTAIMELSSRLSATLDTEKTEAAADALAAIGKTALFEAIIAGERPELSLYKDTDTVLALYSVKSRVMPPWRFFGSFSNPPMSADHNALLGYNPKIARHSLHPAEPVVIRLPNDRNGDFSHLVRNEDGTYTESGWTYSVVADFVEGLWKDELEEFPGLYYSRIRSFRARIKALSPVAPEHVKVVVDTTGPELNKWDEQNIREFREKYQVTETATGFEFVPTMESVDPCIRLPKVKTRWIYSPAVDLGITGRVPAQENLFVGIGA